MDLECMKKSLIYCEKKYGRKNIFQDIHLSKVQLSDQFDGKIENIWSYINKSLLFYNKFGQCKIYIKRFQEIPFYHQLLKNLSEVDGLVEICIWDSDLSEKFFDIIQYPNLLIQRLQIMSCSLKKPMNIHRLVLLDFVSFKSCSISNQFLHYFMKTGVDTLSHIELDNTKITNDSFKLIQKLSAPILSKLYVTRHAKMNASLLCKAVSRMKSVKLPSFCSGRIQIAINSLESSRNQHFLFVNISSKMVKNPEMALGLYFKVDEQNSDQWFERMMIPDKTDIVLDRMPVIYQKNRI